MAENNEQPQVISIKEMALAAFNKIKTPVFWMAMGAVLYAVFDHKKIKRLSNNG